MGDYVSGLYTTESGDGSIAHWRISDEAIRVAVVILPNGDPQVFDDMPTLGECVDLMPRELWNTIRVEYGDSEEFKRYREKSAITQPYYVAKTVDFNGLFSLECPSCGTDARVQGNAMGIWIVEHAADDGTNCPSSNRPIKHWIRNEAITDNE